MPSRMGDIVFDTSPFGPPKAPGVYLVTLISPETKRRKVFYVGCSKDICSRVTNQKHPYYILYQRFSDKFYVVTESCITDNYINLEKEAIRFFNPVMNTANKTKKNG